MNQKNISIQSLSHAGQSFSPSKSISEKAHIRSLEEYQKKYSQSINDSHNFWLNEAKLLNWFSFPTKSCAYTWETDKKIEHTWFADGTLNVSVNCLDRHLPKRKNQVAILWQGEKEEEVRKITYGELYIDVCRFANALKNLGVKKGDRVCIYMPMVPEGAIAMLACTRVGAIHSIVFGGFSAHALRDRIQDSQSSLLITADVGFRAGKEILLKEIADQALTECPSIKKSIVFKRGSGKVSMQKDRDVWWHEVIEKTKPENQAEVMKAEDPLFILYTSGSTGKPKGVLHTTAGYLLHVTSSFKYIFDYQEGEVFWCTADIGWVTGHSYLVYGPLANGATTLLFEGVPTHPHPDRFWQMIDKHQVNIFYTAPTAIRALMREGDQWPKKYKLDSLRILGSVGEPINPEAWAWYHREIGHSHCPIVDTWWQTETGGILISPFPGASTLKPGSANHPFFGVELLILRDDGSTCDVNEGGKLCIKKPWPGMMRTTWGDHDRFIQTYFSTFKNLYFTGDGCRQDKDGDYWLLGRIDDVVNISGHRIGTAEVESALVSNPNVSEAAVVPIPHDIKGQSIYAFVSLKDGIKISDQLKNELFNHVKKEIGAIAKPEVIQFAVALPKTRSGKIMRRILRKIAEGDLSNLGDTSTLADPTVVEKLAAERIAY